MQRAARGVQRSGSSGSVAGGGDRARCLWIGLASWSARGDQPLFGGSVSGSVSIPPVRVLTPIRYPCGPLKVRTRHLQLHLDHEELDSRTFSDIIEPSRHTLASLHLTSLGESTTAENLVGFLTAAQFPSVRFLTLEDSDAFSAWPRIIKSLPSLINLVIIRWTASYEEQVFMIRALGNSVSVTILHLCCFLNDPDSLKEILHLLHRPNFAGIRHLELPTIGKEDFASEAGLALLNECEKRSISLLCRYGYM